MRHCYHQSTYTGDEDAGRPPCNGHKTEQQLPSNEHETVLLSVVTNLTSDANRVTVWIDNFMMSSISSSIEVSEDTLAG